MSRGPPPSAKAGAEYAADAAGCGAGACAELWVHGLDGLELGILVFQEAWSLGQPQSDAWKAFLPGHSYCHQGVDLHPRASFVNGEP